MTIINTSPGPRFDAHGRLIPEGAAFNLHAPAAVASVTPAFLAVMALATAIGDVFALPAADTCEAIARTSDLAALSVLANISPSVDVRDAAHQRLRELHDAALPPREEATSREPEEEEEDDEADPSAEELAKLDEPTRAIAQGKPAEVVAAIASLVDLAQLEVLATDNRKTVAKAAKARLAALKDIPPTT